MVVELFRHGNIVLRFADDNSTSKNYERAQSRKIWYISRESVQGWMRIDPATPPVVFAESGVSSPGTHDAAVFLDIAHMMSFEAFMINIPSALRDKWDPAFYVYVGMECISILRRW